MPLQNNCLRGQRQLMHQLMCCFAGIDVSSHHPFLHSSERLPCIEQGAERPEGGASAARGSAGPLAALPATRCSKMTPTCSCCMLHRLPQDWLILSGPVPSRRLHLPHRFNSCCSSACDNIMKFMQIFAACQYIHAMGSCVGCLSCTMQSLNFHSRFNSFMFYSFCS